MIDNSLFIKETAHQRVKSQRCYVLANRVFNIIFPCKAPTKGKETENYTYLTICCKRGLDMTSASLYSLYKNASKAPNRIIIVSDGSWDPEYGVNYLAKRNIKAECIRWETCADYYRQSFPELATWAEKHIWGKKMVAIMYVSETDKTLFSDPDVLWYSNPLRDDEWATTKFKISIDNCHSYDAEYIKKTHSEYLYDTEDPINCGVVYMHGGLSLLNEEAKNCIRYQAEHCGRFAEQTVFAIMDIQHNNRWSREEVVSSIDDVVQPFFSKTILYPNTIARHYLYRLKWIYWTEFFKMRFFK